MILTATSCPLASPFLTRAEQVFPKCPRPTSFPSSYFAAKFFPYPKLLSNPLSGGGSVFTGEAVGAEAAAAPAPSLLDSWTGLAGTRGGLGEAAPPKRLAREALMCLAGEGGGKGRRKKRRGVERAGEGATPCGRGLGQTLGGTAAAGVVVVAVVVGGERRPWW